MGSNSYHCEKWQKPLGQGRAIYLLKVAYPLLTSIDETKIFVIKGKKKKNKKGNA